MAHQRIAVAIPPHDQADDVLLGVMSFKRIKTLRNIVLVTHSDCGGAGIAAAPPYGTADHENRLHRIIREGIHKVGPGIADLTRTFTEKAADGAGRVNFLAQEIGRHSLANLLTFPGVKDRVRSGQLNIALAFYDIAADTLDVYDSKNQAFRPVDNHPDLDHFCARDLCQDCTCTARLAP